MNRKKAVAGSVGSSIGNKDELDSRRNAPPARHSSARPLTAGSSGNGFPAPRPSVRPAAAQPLRRRHGHREIRDNLSMEFIMGVLGHGARMDILRQLAASSMNVSTIAHAIYLGLNSVSHDLGVLEECGLVRWTRIKNSRIYSLSDRVRTFPRADMIQVCITNGNGHWMIIHFDDSADPDQGIEPPMSFVDNRF